MLEGLMGKKPYIILSSAVDDDSHLKEK